MSLAEVKPLPTNDLQDVPLLLSRLAEQCKLEGIDAVVTVCVSEGEIDVRGIGQKADVLRCYALVMQAARFLEKCIHDEMTAR